MDGWMIGWLDRQVTNRETRSVVKEHRKQLIPRGAEVSQR